MQCTQCGATPETPLEQQTGLAAVTADRVRIYPQMKPSLMRDVDLGQLRPKKDH
jgi:hypothetical protein